MATPGETVLAAAQKRRAKYDLPYYGAVLPSEAQTLLKAFPNARLIDVRTRPEWDYVGRVPGSILIEWTTYPAGTRNPAFLDELKAVADDPQAPLLFFCRSGALAGRAGDRRDPEKLGRSQRTKCPALASVWKNELKHVTREMF